MSTDVVARLESVAARLEAYAAKLGLGSGGGGESKGHPGLPAYDDWSNGPVAAFEKAAHDLKLNAHANFVKSGVAEVRKVIEASFHCKKPSDKKYLSGILEVVTAVDKAIGRKDDPHFFHQKSLFELIGAFSWVDAPGPVSHVEAQNESAAFYLNSILTAAKKAATEEEKAQHRAYVKTIKDLLTSLTELIRNDFKLGLTWNVKGGDFASHKPGQSSSSSSSSSGGPPSAPALPPSAPPLAPSLPESTTSTPAPSGGGMSAVFASINAGQESSTATQAFGLKHVSKEMKSKNISAPVLTPKEKKDNEIKAAKALIASESKAKEPRMALDKGTWVVEHYRDQSSIELPEVQMKQAVYILNCVNCVIKIPEKCKQITMDSCAKTFVQFKNVVSTFEIVNSKGCKVQIDEACPSVAIDKTHGFSVILMGPAYANPPEIITSNVSELNLVHPGATDKDDPIEIPLPEQHLTKIEVGKSGKAAKLTTGPVSHGG